MISADRNNMVTNEDREKPFECKRTKVFQPSTTTSRIAAQSGWFTLHMYDSKNNKFYKFEENPMYKGRLTKLKISSEAFYKLRLQLSRMGVNASTMLPELDGLGSHLKFVYFKEDDEKGKELFDHYVILEKRRPTDDVD